MKTTISSKKVNSYEAGAYSETVEFQVMHLADVEDNSNKFYCIELQKTKDDKWRIFTHYGRLGKSNIYEVRETGNELTSRIEYDKLLKSKLRKYTAIDVIAPTVGSSNIRKKTVSTKISTTAINFNGIDKQIASLITQFNEENIHSITSSSSITYSVNGGFETPLGPITQEHVKKARTVLDNIKKLSDDKKLVDSNNDTVELNNDYLSLVPHSFSHKIEKEQWILTDEQIVKEYDLLSQLETAVSIRDKDNEDITLKSLGLEIAKIDNPQAIKELDDWFNRSRSKHHGNLSRWKVVSIYQLNIESDNKRWNDKGNLIDNKVDLFHGSKNCNILSILTRGFVIPPHNAPHVTGRMFGNGVYAASESTKALNYSAGYWSPNTSKYKNIFLFITRFAMGNKFETTSPQYNGPPKGYDSIHAKAGKSLLHDEYIVYNLGQTHITHLIELKEK